MNNDIAARIDKILLAFQLTPSAFSDAIQIPRAIMSHILSRRNKPSLEVVQKILKNYPQINTDWLLTGTGTMIQLNIFEEENLAPTSNPIEKSSSSASISKLKSTENIKPQEKVEQEILHSENIAQNIMEIDADKKEDQKTPELSTLPSISNQKKIEKIIFFYSDKTFSIQLPE